MSNPGNSILKLLCLLCTFCLQCSAAAPSGKEYEKDYHGSKRDVGGGSALFCMNSESTIRTATQRWPNQVVPYSLKDSLSEDERKSIVSILRSWENSSCYIFAPKSSESDFISFGSNNSDRCCIEELLSGRHHHVHIAACSHQELRTLIGRILGVVMHPDTTSHDVTEREGASGETSNSNNLQCNEWCGRTISAHITPNSSDDIYGRGSLQSPHHPSDYPPLLDCYWKIRAPDGYALKVKFRVLDIEPPSFITRQCDYDYLSVTNLNSRGTVLRHERFCDSPELDEVNSDMIDREIDLETTAILIHFHSDDTYSRSGFNLDYIVLKKVMNYSDPCSVSNGGCAQLCSSDVYGRHSHCDCREGYTLNSDSRTCRDVNECQSHKGGCQHKCHNTEGSFLCSCQRGFRLSTEDMASCIECNLHLNSSSGDVRSRDYPAPYPHMQSCTWTLTPWPSHRLQITIDHLDIVSSEKCKVDFLKVANAHFPNQRRLCGHLPNIQYYSMEVTKLLFRSRTENVNHSGFRLLYKQVAEKQLTPLDTDYVFVDGKKVPFKKRHWLQ